MPRSVRYRVCLVFAAAVIAAAAAVAVVSARGSFRVIDATHPGADSSAWRSCQSRAPRSDRELLKRCVVVRGTLLHQWRDYDQTGRLVELHILVLAHFRLYVIKAHEPFPRRLAFGRSLTTIGALVIPDPSHFSIREVDAAVVTGA